MRVNTPRYQPPRYRVILLFLALCCAVGSALPWPNTADATSPSGPVGGDRMGTTGTVSTSAGKPLPSDLTGTSYVIADVTSGKVLAAKKPHWRNEPASILKTLTALTVLRNIPLDTKVAPVASDLKVECTCVGLTAGKQYTVDALLNALLMRSGNDVANVLARAGGGKEKFLALMNKTAQQLQAYDIRAKTPSGLNVEGQTASAYDMALVLRAGLADPRFRKYLSTRTYDFGPVGGPTKRLSTQNELAKLGYDGQIGSKNGWTTPAGHTFTAAAKRGERTLQVTILHANRAAGDEAAALLDWGFSLPESADGVGTLVNPSTNAPSASSGPTSTPEPTPSGAAADQVSAPPSAPANAPAPATTGMISAGNDVSQPRVTIQAGLSVGAIGLAGLALLPGRRPPKTRHAPSREPGRERH